MDFRDVAEVVVNVSEAVGIAVLMVGLIFALGVYTQNIRRGHRITAYQTLKSDIGRVILLGLEILIIADIIRTITVEVTLESAAVLGAIVLVRTFLSFSLEIELEGVLPWRRAELELEKQRDLRELQARARGE
jgi:uncharacterized membrane protein